MDKIKVTIFFLITLITKVLSQNNVISVDTISQDIENATKIVLKDSLIININGKISSFGSKEILEPKRLSEKNSCWLAIKPQDCGVLTFTIIPNNSTTNVDFAIFSNKINNSKIDSQLILRENLSVQGIKNNQTGLDNFSIEKRIGKMGRYFCKGLSVKQGQEILLYINSDKPILDPIKILVGYKKNTALKLYVVEFPNKKPIKANLYFNTDKYDDYDLEFGISNKISCNPSNSRLHKNFHFVEVAEKNHVSEFVTKSDMECGFEDSLLYLQKIQKDSLIIFSNALKQGDKEPNEIAIHCFYNFLKNNPKIKVELLFNFDNEQGIFVQDLNSLKKIKAKLIEKGLNENRVKISNTKPYDIKVKAHWQLNNSVLYRIIEM